MKDFKQLLFWQKSHFLTLKIYSITKNTFPKEEMYGLVSQMRRSSSSIPTNIAEGCGRNSSAELKRFLTISTGSCSELEYQLLLSKDLLYISDDDYLELSNGIIEIRKMIYSYISTLNI
ncbi:MAG: four helix bundle protein [Pedobacter sp.]|nr:four helix bundle protein [Pedobacter sp.]